MRRLAGRAAAAVLFLVLASSSFGQIVGVQTSTPHLGVTAAGCSVLSSGNSRIQAYTAEIKTTTVQLLANGATITSESTEIRAVDSQQRTLNSRTEPRFSADQPAFTLGYVDDPVENTQINWESQTKTARVTKLPPDSQRHGCWATDSGNTRMNFGPETPPDPETLKPQMKVEVPPPAPVSKDPEPKVEDLGTMTIQGVEAQGRRWTTVIPAGRIGNDRELIQTNEIWFAPSLGFEVRHLIDDPQSGKTTTDVTHLDLSEPPLSTFRPPEGYEVTVEELHQVSCEQSHIGGIVDGAPIGFEAVSRSQLIPMSK